MATAAGRNAYLIDPAKQTIEQLTWKGDEPGRIAKFIGADYFDIAKVVRHNGVWAMAFVDDNGMLKENACFTFDGYGAPLAGKALLLGCDRHGNTVECPLTLNDVLSRVRLVAQESAIAAIKAAQAIDAADLRARGYTVEQRGLVQIITKAKSAA